LADGKRNAVSTFAFCWQVERRDGAGVALTSSDAPLRIGGHVFDPAPGLVPGQLRQGGPPGEELGEAQGAITAQSITEDDLLAGRWDGARARLFTVEVGTGTGESIPLADGELGEIALEGQSFAADLLGAGSKLRSSPFPRTSPECRAQLGDKACRVDLAGRSSRFRVVDFDGAKLTLSPPCEERFVAGSLRWLTGQNCGTKSLVLAVEDGAVRLRELPRATVMPGEIVTIVEGCDKRFETCVSRFSNAVNFRGEPFLPGNDLLTRYPGA